MCVLLGRVYEKSCPAPIGAIPNKGISMSSIPVSLLLWAPLSHTTLSAGQILLVLSNTDQDHILSGSSTGCLNNHACVHLKRRQSRSGHTGNLSLYLLLVLLESKHPRYFASASRLSQYVYLWELKAACSSETVKTSHYSLLFHRLYRVNVPMGSCWMVCAMNVMLPRERVAHPTRL